ncbi:MAG: imidazolonepropionase [Gammaproteobacteria bacterium]|nr:imidazolonepropionase [Gammaproteobacteria bacterium]
MILTNATIATMVAPYTDSSFGLIDNASIVVIDEKIKWVGKTSALPDSWSSSEQILDCQGNLITPGLIDCHTHLVYAGNRAREFELRLEGASYEEIANSGGGIVSTVTATRNASGEDLLQQSMPRLKQLMSEGVTTVEIKSGYGLDTENEIKMLRVAQELADKTGVRISKTFLGAHALPAEFKNDADGYIRTVCEEMLPRAYHEGLVDAVDGFTESIAFNVEQMERVFEIAQSYHLPIKLHAEQLSDLGGAKMAAQRGALSVDHLEYLNPLDVDKLGNGKTVAVMLPGAFYVLRETQLPPIAALREKGIPMAIASDCNPGSSPVTSLLLSMNMACTLFGMTPSEALGGVTIQAARALGLEKVIGSIEPDKQADLVIWDTDHPATLSYHIGLNPCAAIMIGGKWQKCLPWDHP